MSGRERDQLRRFLFDKLSVRGALARLDDTWAAVTERRDYPQPVRRVLGEGLAACALLHATLKFDGQLSLQLQADGPLRLLVIQCGSDGGLRATARWDGEAALPASGLGALCGAGTLALTLEPRGGGERYQGVVELAGDGLADALAQYFERSEQLPTLIRLGVDADTAAGFMLQRLPAQSDDDDGWNRVSHLGATLSRDELLGVDDRTLLRRLFHEEELRLFAPQPLVFDCRCSRRRSAAMLVGLGRDDVQALLEERGDVEVSCDFCGKDYRFDAVDAEQLFAPPAPDLPDTRH